MVRYNRLRYNRLRYNRLRYDQVCYNKFYCTLILNLILGDDKQSAIAKQRKSRPKRHPFVSTHLSDRRIIFRVDQIFDQ